VISSSAPSQKPWELASKIGIPFELVLEDFTEAGAAYMATSLAYGARPHALFNSGHLIRGNSRTYRGCAPQDGRPLALSQRRQNDVNSASTR
jgi:hypothetical protein